MASSGGRLVLAALALLGLATAVTGAAVGDAVPAPVTIRGATINAAAPAAANGTHVVLRGSAPPAAPPVASDTCPTGDTDQAGLGCASPASVYQPDYDWYLPYVDFGPGAQAPHLHRHAVAGRGRMFGHLIAPGHRLSRH